MPIYIPMLFSLYKPFTVYINMEVSYTIYTPPPKTPTKLFNILITGTYIRLVLEHFIEEINTKLLSYNL